MTISPDIVVLCQCGAEMGPIPLPASTLAYITAHPQGPTLGFGPLYVACPSCKLVFDGEHTNYRLHVVQTKDRRGIPVNRVPIRALRACGTDNCASRIAIYSTVDGNKSTSELLAELAAAFAQWHFAWDVRCENKGQRHYLRSAPPMEPTFDWRPLGKTDFEELARGE